jgi:hypothetical protein
MGGSISVESTLGRGSRFTINLPAYIEDRDVEATSSPILSSPPEAIVNAI